MIRRPTGFTLIELLVVMAIIAILMGIMGPAFSTAIDRANLDTCQMRLRQVGLATKMYFEDYGDYPPSLRALYASHYVDDDSLLLCSRTGRPFHYRRPPPDGDRDAILAACVNPVTQRGRRPHFFGDAYAQARLGGKVDVRR